VEFFMLVEAAYGKSSVRLVRVTRHGDRHDLRDLTVAIRFEGDYSESFTDGDNSGVLPTDTMKNTVYALAARDGVNEPEDFGVALARHFLDRNPLLGHVRVDLLDHFWGRIPVGDREHGQAFARVGPDFRTARVTGTRDRTEIDAGVADLLILKTGHSAFTGYPHDELTTLPETRDRILATSLTATWRYTGVPSDFRTHWRVVRSTLLEAFAEHDSRSVQHTLHAMGEAVLRTVDVVESIHLVMPNRHHLPVDLSAFGLENRNEIFVATTEPYGLIEATIAR
jgi:urate oxidase